MPFSTCGQMGSSPYLFRSGFNAGISFGEDVRPAGYPRAELVKGDRRRQADPQILVRRFYPLSTVTLKRPTGA